MITFKQAKELQYGDVLVTAEGKRWRVSGQVKLWKKPENAHRIRVPLKHGLYRYGVLTEADFTNGVCDLLTKEK